MRKIVALGLAVLVIGGGVLSAPAVADMGSTSVGIVADAVSQTVQSTTVTMQFSEGDLYKKKYSGKLVFDTRDTEVASVGVTYNTSTDVSLVTFRAKKKGAVTLTAKSGTSTYTFNITVKEVVQSSTTGVRNLLQLGNKINSVESFKSTNTNVIKMEKKDGKLYANTVGKGTAYTYVYFKDGSYSKIRWVVTEKVIRGETLYMSVGGILDMRCDAKRYQVSDGKMVKVTLTANGFTIKALKTGMVSVTYFDSWGVRHIFDVVIK